MTKIIYFMVYTFPLSSSCIPTSAYFSGWTQVMLFKLNQTVIWLLIHVTQPDPFRWVRHTGDPDFIDGTFEKTCTVICHERNAVKKTSDRHVRRGISRESLWPFIDWAVNQCAIAKKQLLVSLSDADE